MITNKYEILAVFANDFGKAFEFVRQEMRDACIEIVRTESDIVVGPESSYPGMRQRMIDRIRKVGPIE